MSDGKKKRSNDDEEGKKKKKKKKKKSVERKGEKSTGWFAKDDGPEDLSVTREDGEDRLDGDGIGDV